MPARFSSAVIPENILRCMKPEDRRVLGVETRAELDVKISEKSESKEQKLVEMYLMQHGFLPATVDMIQSGKAKGYYWHLNNTRRNPLLLDLLILDARGRYLMIEMKVRDVWQPGQKELVAQGYGVVAWSAAEAIEKIKGWMNE